MRLRKRTRGWCYSSPGWDLTFQLALCLSSYWSVDDPWQPVLFSWTASTIKLLVFYWETDSIIYGTYIHRNTTSLHSNLNTVVCWLGKNSFYLVNTHVPGTVWMLYKYYLGSIQKLKQQKLFLLFCFNRWANWVWKNYITCPRASWQNSGRQDSSSSLKEQGADVQWGWGKGLCLRPHCSMVRASRSPLQAISVLFQHMSYWLQEWDITETRRMQHGFPVALVYSLGPLLIFLTSFLSLKPLSEPVAPKHWRHGKLLSLVILSVWFAFYVSDAV